jgi:hypothetical protein
LDEDTLLHVHSVEVGVLYEPGPAGECLEGRRSAGYVSLSLRETIYDNFKHSLCMGIEVDDW